MTVAQFSWIHLIAAIVLGLSMGWNLAIYVWNHQARRARIKSRDPLRLAERKVLVPYKQGEKITGWTEIKVVPDRESA